MTTVPIGAERGRSAPPRLAPTFTSNALNAGNTYTIANDGRTILVFKGGSADMTVTVATPVTYRGLAVVDPEITLTGGTEVIVGPFDSELYGATLSFSVGGTLTDWTIAAVQI